jgi:menaquinone-dependent protoporphyrinogen oxidase
MWIQMNQPKILIAYGSRYGCTEEISLKIASYLEKTEGLCTEVVNLRTIAESAWPRLVDFQGILLGTGIRIGKWTKEAESFLKKIKRRFINGRPAIGVFISCGYAADAKHYPIAMRSFLEKKFKDIGFHPDIYEAFGGIFDFSSSSNKSIIDRRILKWGSSDLKLTINDKKRNDYRNWERVYSFSHSFAEMMKKIMTRSKLNQSLIHSI